MKKLRDYNMKNYIFVFLVLPTLIIQIFTVVLLARSADKMNVLTATNTELLTVFTENIATMNEGVGNLQGPFNQLATLQEHFEKTAPDLTEIKKNHTELNRSILGLRGDIKKLTLELEKLAK